MFDKNNSILYCSSSFAVHRDPKITLTEGNQVYRLIPDYQVENADVLVHAVCCQGLAHDPYSKMLKKCFPKYFQEYTRLCLRGNLNLDSAIPVPLDVLFGTQAIVIWPVRHSWKDINRPEILRPALKKLHEALVKVNLETVYIPEMEGPPSGWIQKELVKLQETSPNP